MARKLTFRQLVLSILALVAGLGHKEIGARLGLRRESVADYLGRKRNTELDDTVYERLLSAFRRGRAAASITAAFLEALEALDRDSDLTEEELAAIEQEVLAGSRILRKLLARCAEGPARPASRRAIRTPSKLASAAGGRRSSLRRSALAVSFCHVCRYAEAADLVEQTRRLAADLGDKIDMIRLHWLEGRILAGRGRREEALRLLAEARESFAAEQMFYDVTLALLEEGALLLDENRTQRSRRSPGSCRRSSSPRASTVRPWPPCGSSRKRRSGKRRPPSSPAASCVSSSGRDTTRACGSSHEPEGRWLMEALRAGNVIADLVRTGIREHYGAGSEKLVEFGIEPFRSRKRKPAPAPTKPEPEPEPVESLSPTSTPDTVK